jgi:hypothetical protein
MNPDSLIQLLLTVVAGFAVSELRRMSVSINKLNENVAILLTKVTSQESRINKLERKFEQGD